MRDTDNVNIKEIHEILHPSDLKNLLPLLSEDREFIFNSRVQLQNILSNNDKRIFVVVGPCSIHDPEAALEYARKLRALSDELSNELFIIMRVYFEKPRTTVGWKGLINDPFLNDTFKLEDGLKIARKLMLDITRLGLPIGTEALDPISPHYLSDSVTWSAIGARTTESQTHREMASGLSSPVGFKNGTDGNVEVAINGMLSALTPHAFLGINDNGNVSIIQTKGNQFGHVILRGGTNGPNYDSVSVRQTEETLMKYKLPLNIVIDCSHANSHKNHKLQPNVIKDISLQLANGNNSIKGVMLESNLLEGNQKLNPAHPEDLQYGLSITDACINWEDTENTLRQLAQTLKNKQ